MKIGPFSKKKKIIIKKESDRNERNFEVYVVIIGGMYMPKINNLGEQYCRS